MKSKREKPPRPRTPGAIRPAAPVSARSGRRCPIVGVGASAGGLEAFTQLLKRLPLDTGFGFVLVQHLDPQHESALTQILARATEMPVCEVTNNLRVKANHVYIIPPNTSLGIGRGILQLRPRSHGRLAARAIDFFFEALAKDQRERAIGVILSGNATDGTLGLEAIKAEGGLTFAQDDSARYDSMPRNAVAAGCVDRVLSPGNIADELVRIARHPYRASPSPGGDKRPSSRGRVPAKIKAPGRVFRALSATLAPAADPEKDGYQKIVSLLRHHSGVDFSLYKSPTIRRRIVRRAVLSQRDTLASYAHFLQGNTSELDALYADALISVTSFFRNGDAFAALQDRVFSPLLRQRTGEPVRVWVLGCSTGQEAYSLAMAYAESAEKTPRPRKLQMFATDLNEANLDKARHGFYPRSLAQEVSPARLRRFFAEEKGGYRVIKSLRESIVFARQNIIGDPPFSRLDLISCRNLMIYLEPSLQKRVLPTFHYALKPGGFLFLGASESIGGFGDLFVPVDKKQRIFSKKASPMRAFHLPARTHGREGSGPEKAPGSSGWKGRNQRRKRDAFRSELDAEREADRLILNQFAPPGVLINGDLQILQFRGPTGAYLEPPTGKASFDLLRMARDGLMLPLREAIGRAMKENKVAHKENVPVAQGGKTRMVNLEVIPLKNLREICFLVLFSESAKQRSGGLRPAKQPNEAAPARFSAARKDDSNRIAGLQRDLSEARDYLHSVQEHQETANEELQASNEEGQSANEELQSLNEELETSKEELESTNEELTTVNEEMVSRNAELNQLIAGRKKAEEALLKAQCQLTSHAGKLEKKVGERTAKLTATNRQLKTSVNSIRKGKEEYRSLLAESQVMQEKLRHLTHQILTAQEEDRKEISRELHDGVVQTLIGINVELTALGVGNDIDPRALKKKIVHTQKLVENSVTAVHRFARGLRPAVLDDLGLIPALHAYCKSLSAQRKLNIQMTAFRGIEALDGAGKIVLFRVAQEALNNVVRHARATRIKVGISEAPGLVQMEIGDNGQSFPVEKILRDQNPKRLGLIGMKERIEMIGGNLTIRSAPGTGTLVRVSIPFTVEKPKK